MATQHIDNGMGEIVRKKELCREKKELIKELLRDERITFGMALSVIRGIEAEILKNRDTFLKKVPFKNVSP